MSSKSKEKSYTRDISGLRDALFDEIEDIRDGVSSPHEAVAFCSLAEKVLDTYSSEIKAEAFNLQIEERKQQLQERELQLKEKQRYLEYQSEGENDDYEEESEEELQIVRFAN